MSEQEINRIIAENIVRYMEKKGLTQVDVAEYMGVSQATVSNWCKGIKMPRMDKIDRLCELFGCSRTDLLDEQKIEEDPRQKAFDDPQMKKLFDMFENVSEEKRAAAIKFFEAFLGENKDE